MTSTSCQICERKLTDAESIARGFGPDCAATRGAFLASCSTSDAEMATLEAAGDASAKWIRNFRTEMRAGRVRQGRQCIEFARFKAAQEVPAPAPVETVETIEPFIVVRQIARGGYYVRTPFKLAGFVDAFKRVVGGTWRPESEEWYVPASQLTWTVEALQYWFGLPVRVEAHAPAIFAPIHAGPQFSSALQR